MKLLIITQAVDLDDPTLSAYHSWILAIARRADKATVICLKKGRNIFPKEIEVISLGKESNASHLSYIHTLFSSIWSHRKEYDAVFVHMNQEYILIAGWLWKLLGKRIYFWRNHYKGSLLTNIAVGLCDKVFYTSISSYTARFKRSVRMPAGVSVEKHARMSSIKRVPHSILSLGRIAPSKNIHLFVEALGILKKEMVEFTASIYGNALLADAEYERALHSRVKELELQEAVSFYPGVPNEKTPEVYNKHEIFINISPQGMFDKTILEAAACGCIVITGNKDAAEYLNPSTIIQSTERQEIAQKLAFMLRAEASVRENFISQGNSLVSYHSIVHLGDRLLAEMSS